MAETLPDPNAPDGRPPAEEPVSAVRQRDPADGPAREPFRAPWSDAVSANA